jgi:nitrite reductase/ring-hydroxylating ferredoxin subunit
MEGPKIFRVGNREIAVFHSDGRYFAVKNLCPHHGVELGKGSVVNNRVRCPGHGFQFDLETGQCDRDPALCASTFEVKVQSGELFVRLL